MSTIRKPANWPTLNTIVSDVGKTHEITKVALECDAVQNPKMKEYIFFRSIEVIKGLEHLMHKHFHHLETSKDQTYMEMLKLRTQFNQLIYKNPFPKDLIRFVEFRHSQSSEAFTIPMGHFSIDLTYNSLYKCYFISWHNSAIRDPSRIKPIIKLDVFSNDIVNKLKNFQANQESLLNIKSKAVELYGKLKLPRLSSKYNQAIAYFLDYVREIGQSPMEFVKVEINGPVGELLIFPHITEHAASLMIFPQLNLGGDIMIGMNNIGPVINGLSEMPNLKSLFIGKIINEIIQGNSFEKEIEQTRKQIEIDRLYFQLMDSKTINTAIENEIDEKENELESLNQSIEEAKVLLEQLEDKNLLMITEAIPEMSNAFQGNDAMETFFKIYRMVVSKFRNKNRKRRMEMEQKKKDMEKDLELKLRELNKQRQASMSDLISRENELLRKKQEAFNDVQSKKTSLEKDYESKMKEIERLQEEFDQDCEQYEAEAVKWKAEQEHKFIEYEDFVEHLPEFRRAFQETQAECKTLQGECDKYRAQLEQLQKELEQYKSTTNNMRMLLGMNDQK